MENRGFEAFDVFLVLMGIFVILIVFIFGSPLPESNNIAYEQKSIMTDNVENSSAYLKTEMKVLNILLQKEMKQDPHFFDNKAKVNNSSLEKYQEKGDLFYLAKEGDVAVSTEPLKGEFYEISPQLIEKIKFQQVLDGIYYYSKTDDKVYFKDNLREKQELEEIKRKEKEEQEDIEDAYQIMLFPM